MKKFVTMKDVAKKANVSVATVSIVLNNENSTRISSQTSKRVLQAAKALNYQPDINAQVLRGKASTTVGLILPSISNNFYPEMAEGIMEKATELGYNVVMFNTRNDLEKEKFSLNTLASMRASGIIVAGVDHSPQEEINIFENIVQKGIHIVRVDRYEPPCKIPSVSINNNRAAYDMTMKLIADGHTHIALVLPVRMIHTMQERYNGFIRAMSERKIPFSQEDILSVNQDSSDDIERILKIVLDRNKGGQHYTALFNVACDQCTVKFVQLAKKYGCRIPEDLSIAGFDGISLGDVITPSLTTIQQPIYEIGLKAMEVLADLIAGNKVQEHEIFLPYKLLSRQSTRQILVDDGTFANFNNAGS